MIIVPDQITPRQKLIIAKALCDYQYIMENWHVNDKDFQDIYYEFYLKSRWAVMSDSNNKRVYFDKLKSISPEDDLIMIVRELHKCIQKHSFELSLASKMLHTRNPSRPIYDKKIRDYLSKEENVNFWWQIANRKSGVPKGTTDEEKIEHDWKMLCDWYNHFLRSQRGNEWIRWFNTNFPAYNKISDVKKVDFIIFATN